MWVVTSVRKNAERRQFCRAVSSIHKPSKRPVMIDSYSIETQCTSGQWKTFPAYFVKSNAKFYVLTTRDMNEAIKRTSRVVLAEGLFNVNAKSKICCPKRTYAGLGNSCGLLRRKHRKPSECDFGRQRTKNLLFQSKIRIRVDWILQFRPAISECCRKILI